MGNMKFNYLYRDAGNYKNWANVIFSNFDGLSPAVVTALLRSTLLGGDLFIAGQIRIPEAFLFAEGSASSDDHCFHEFDRVEISHESPNDRYGRSMNEFLAEVTREAKNGWWEFNPLDGALYPPTLARESES